MLEPVREHLRSLVAGSRIQEHGRRFRGDLQLYHPGLPFPLQGHHMVPGILGIRDVVQHCVLPFFQVQPDYLNPHTFASLRVLGFPGHGQLG